jgi:UDP-N-acetylmuramoylalanine--D-glutamate ligase
MYLKNKNVLVYGFSISGRSAAELLADEGAKVFCYDDKEVNGLPPNVTLVSDLKRGIDNCDLIVLSPSISVNNKVIQSAIKNGKDVISELELGYRFCNSDIVAITGTNGKTTTTLLVNEILNRAGKDSYALGNIGLAFSGKVKSLTPNDTAVVEVSSFQLEAVKYFSPDISAILNITPDHLDRHKSIDEYLKAKSNIFKQQASQDYAVFNADDPLVKQLCTKSCAKNYFFSKNMRINGAYVEKDVIYFETDERIAIASTSEIALAGEHNLENALAATAICMLKGVNPEIIRMVLKTFTLPDFRMQYIGEKRGK